MKKLLPLLILSFGFMGSAYSKICDETSTIQIRNDVLFLPNQTQPFSGENLCAYENGQHKVQGEYTNGLKDGKWTSWGENGIKKIELVYMLGSLQTKTLFSPIHYQKVEQTNYTNGIEEISIAWIYFDNGKLKEKKSFKNKKRHGIATYWYQTGNKEYEGNFIDGVPNGVWIHWHENGKKEEEGVMVNGARNGTSTHWDENGIKLDEINYMDGKINGLWRSFHKNGQKYRDRYFEKGKRVGKEITWHPGGQIAEVGNYKLDKMAGVWTSYYPSGQKMEEGIRDYLHRLGIWTNWYENGQKSSEGAYIHMGIFPHGKWTEWYKNGQKKSEGSYAYDEPPDNGPDGVWSYWNKNGQKTNAMFKDGKCISGDCSASKNTRWSLEDSEEI